MTRLLFRLFIKEREQMAETELRAAVGKLAGSTGIFCNCILFLGKLMAGWLAGSVSILADAVNNLSDASSSVVTLLGFRLAQQPADADHPFGHARYEYLSGLVVAVLILVIGVELVKSSIGKILHPEAVAFSLLTIGILVVSILVKLWMSLFFRRLGKEIKSTTLEATAVDSRNDVISTAAVLLGCLVGYVFHVNIDGYVGLAVAVFILYSGFQIAKETISPLLGEQADAELVQEIRKLVLSHDKVLGVHDLLVHDYGPGRCFASLHVELSAAEDVLVCHEIIDHIENEIKQVLNVDMVIHYDPVVIDDPEGNALHQAAVEVVQEIDPRLSIHDFRLLPAAGGHTVAFDLEIPYDMLAQQEQLPKKIEEGMAAKGKKCETKIHFDAKA